MNSFLLHITFHDSKELKFAGSNDDLLEKLFEYYDKIFNAELYAPACVFAKNEVRLCAGLGMVIQVLLSNSDTYKVRTHKSVFLLKEFHKGNHGFVIDSPCYKKDHDVEIIRDGTGCVYCIMYTSLAAISNWPRLEDIIPKTKYTGNIDYMQEYVKQEVKTMLDFAKSGDNAEVLKRLNIMDYMINSSKHHF